MRGMWLTRFFQQGGDRGELVSGCVRAACFPAESPLRDCQLLLLRDGAEWVVEALNCSGERLQRL